LLLTSTQGAEKVVEELVIAGAGAGAATTTKTATTTLTTTTTVLLLINKAFQHDTFLFKNVD